MRRRGTTTHSVDQFLMVGESLKLQLRTDVGDFLFDELAHRLADGMLLIFFEPSVDKIGGCSDNRPDDTRQECALQIAVAVVIVRIGRIVGISRVEIGDGLHIKLLCAFRWIWKFCDSRAMLPALWRELCFASLYTRDSCAQSL